VRRNWRDVVATLLAIATIGGGLVAFALGCLTLVSENFLDVTARNVLLMGFVVTIVTLWASAIARHAACVVAPPSAAAHV
jgi:hypothetical protein